MKILTPGHKYVLANMEDPSNGQTIQFIQKQPDPNDPKKFVTVTDGTTNEEVVAMLVDRLTVLNAKTYSTFNDLAVVSLQSALTHLEARTQERKARKVEGTSKS